MRYNISVYKFKKYTILLALTIFICSCEKEIFRGDIKGVLGIRNAKTKEIYSDDVFGGFGKGYTLEVYTLSPETLKEFVDKKDKEIPDKNEKGWIKHDWSSPPIDSSDSDIIALALNYYYKGNKKLEEQVEAANENFSKEDILYSFYCRPNKLYPRDVELFILNLKTN